MQPHDLFGRMLEDQRTAQVHYYGRPPEELDGHDRQAYVQTMATAIVTELAEALAEISWKPWATADLRDWTTPYFPLELMDVQFFLLNLMLLVESDPGYWEQVYDQTRDKNADRRSGSYSTRGKEGRL